MNNKPYTKGDVLTAEQIDVIRTAIASTNKACKWTKSSYAYAIGGMQPYSVYSLSYDSFKKQEIIDEFYRLVTTKFYLIQSFTTFKNITL